MTESIRPEDTEDSIHLYGTGQTMADILNAAFDKWGENIDMDNIGVEPVHFHARCLTYDLYDPGDYDPYLLITRKAS